MQGKSSYQQSKPARSGSNSKLVHNGGGGHGTYRRSMSASGSNHGGSGSSRVGGGGGGLYLDIQGGRESPPSDSGGIFDSTCFATTPRFAQLQHFM